MAERMIEANGVDLCVESFGEATDPPILLIMGMGASMLWWDADFCRMLADGGRFVIRYDHRDTGRSVAYEPGRPGYSSAVLFADAARVLDGYEVPAAHVFGVSMGGAIAQLLALDSPDRVRSLVLMSTSPGDGDLPPASDEYTRFLTSAEVDWSDPGSVIEYVVADSRALAGGRRPFDEAATRDLATRDVERARNFASVQNHGLLGGGEGWRDRLPSIAVPTLVIHGTADPLFPLPHGAALAEDILGARILTLQDAGHGLDRADWETVTAAVIEHTVE